MKSGLSSGPLTWNVMPNRPPLLPPPSGPNSRPNALLRPNIGTNVPTEVALVGDAKAITAQLNAELTKNPWQYPSETTWWTGLQGKMTANAATVAPMYEDDAVPMGYYRVLKEVRDLMPRDAAISNEGASTMDIGRVVFPNYLPRHRPDAGAHRGGGRRPGGPHRPG